ncbi:nicotinamidase/pyrazinamidase [Roseovarius litorisediminis]|uniref:Nicotinamidase/pyrazinamidase n=1 Tax=Roseovarius litorisediminis TaxID=1312363 RepID=A0A1Y5TIL5_9RHOB|nr:isochorismatase family cysteine hydrolase [Roseovarius litorisediminis]SLN65169.1 nicotinamidase/pyrazinamidase [Roseovarius litorisediminis]
MTPAALILLIFGALTLWVTFTIRYIRRPTQGPAIAPRPGSALLLVDLQGVFWNDAHYDAQTRARVEAAVLREVALARQKDQPVIVLRHEWSTLSTRLLARLTMNGEAIRGTAGTGLAPPFSEVADQLVIKRVQDGFETGELDVVLRVLRIGTLKIAGLDGEHCVAKTAQAALNRGYDVALIRDGIASIHPDRFAAATEALSGQGARLI